MQESFIHYVWQNRRFNLIDLKTSENDVLEILRVGVPNSDGGPDFFNAQIKIGQTKWAGNVEIHTKSSDWYAHKHEENQIYDKVILHVVWENDREVYRENGEKIPTLELRGRVKKQFVDFYESLVNANSWIPCENQIQDIDDFYLKLQLSKCLIERLEQKAKRIEQVYKINKGDWEATCYQLLAKYFGFKTNALPFELLASSIDMKLIRQYSKDLESLESLLFGQSGFLESNFDDDYPKRIQKNFQFLKNKHQLKPLGQHLWKFLRMRPSNFPTIRISQFAAIWYNHPFLFQKCIQANSIQELKELFRVQSSDYWKSHYNFDKPSQKVQLKNLGNDSIDVLLINAILPLKFFYLKSSGKDIEPVMDLYEEVKAERNQILKRWHSIGVKASSAFESQALIELKNNYCELKKCLNCNIGNAILKINNA